MQITNCINYNTFLSQSVSRPKSGKNISCCGNNLNLNKDVFVQRNIIKKEEDLEKFLDTLFNKIYKHDLNKEAKEEAIRYVYDGKIALGTSLYTNLLQSNKPIAACTVLPVRERKNIVKSVLNGIGVGFNFNNTKHPAKTLLEMNKLLKSMDGKTQRPPAGIAILDINHPEFIEFINTKRTKDYKDWKFNISASIPDKTMDNIVSGKCNSQEAKKYSSIIDSMHYCGEPGLLFVDKVSKNNPLPNHQYNAIASCAEVALENGETCLFSHINLVKFLNNKKEIDYIDLANATRTLSRLLDNVITINSVERPQLTNAVEQKRRFGIGVCGYADLLAEKGIKYGSSEANAILAKCLEVINFSSKKASMELAEERGSFPLFKESRYSELNFLKKHFADSIITDENWKDLYLHIQTKGLRNSTTTSLPPTGSSSRIVNASFSIEPYFTLRNNKMFNKKLHELNLSPKQQKEVLTAVEKVDSIQGIDFLPQNFRDTFRLGKEISYLEHLGVVETAQKFIDDGISKTINLNASATADDIDNIVKIAYKDDLKGISVYRDLL